MAENFDEIRTRSPFSALDGTETLLVNQAGITKGGFISVLKTWILNGLTIQKNQIADSTAYGRGLLSLADTAALKTAAGVPQTASQAEMEAGTLEVERLMTPNLVAEAIAFKAGPREPESITANTTITAARFNSVLVCDAPGAITLILPIISDLTKGSILIINLAPTAVTLNASAVTLIDGTGELATNPTIPQYSQTELIYLGDDTWYVRE